MLSKKNVGIEREKNKNRGMTGEEKKVTCGGYSSVE
jgi:hypothetical protein